MQKSILDAHPNAQIQVAIVWSDRYPGDDAEEAAEAALRLGAGDARVVHYVESDDRPFGLAVSKALGWPEAHDEAAWDIYLFWPPGVAWDQALPVPAHVFYQLGAHADEPGFARGDELAEKLREATNVIVGGAAPPKASDAR